MHMMAEGNTYVIKLSRLAKLIHDLDCQIVVLNKPVILIVCLLNSTILQFNLIRNGKC